MASIFNRLLRVSQPPKYVETLLRRIRNIREGDDTSAVLGKGWSISYYSTSTLTFGPPNSSSRSNGEKRGFVFSFAQTIA